MIHIYRATRYPDHDNFIFQATEDAEKQFRHRFPVKVQEAKQGFEGGLFTYLRDSYRDTFFDIIKLYLRTNYSPPELRLSAFRSVAPLSSLWPIPMWQKQVVDAIRGTFAAKGYKVNENAFSGLVEVIPDKPSFSTENVQIYYGIGFDVKISDDRYAVLRCQPQFKFFMDGKQTNFHEIAKAHSEGSPVTQAVRHFVTRSADDQFDLLQRFVSHISSLPSCEGMTFNQEPVTPQQIGCSTWFWLHDSDACFEVSNGFQTILAQALLTEGAGFYAQPDDIQMIILLPTPDNNPVIPKIDWEQVIAIANAFLAQTLPDVEIPVTVIDYPLEGDFNSVIQKVETAVREFPDRRVLGLMITPGPEARFSSSPQVKAAEAQSFQLNKELRPLFKGGYTATIDWDKLQIIQDIPYIVRNSLLGSLYRLNAQPWLLSNLSFQPEQAETAYFLGLVGNSETFTIAATLFDYQGSLIAFGAVCSDEQVSNSDTDTVGTLIQSLLKEGIHHSKPKPKHIIVHLSSELTTCVEDIQAVLHKLALTTDVIEITQAPTIRFWQPSNKQGTPSHGIAIGNETEKTAYLMNTLSLGEKTNRGYIFPNPEVVAIRQLIGTTPIKNLAAHIYWLSVAHINALHRTVDMPITIAYTKSLYDHVSKSHRSMRVTRNYKRTLYWL